MSDIFRLLAGGGGGARFDKRRFADDVSIFTGAPATDAAAASSSSSKAGSSSGTKLSLPADLDFFGGASAQPAAAAGKAGDAKGKGKAKPEADSGTASEHTMGGCSCSATLTCFSSGARDTRDGRCLPQGAPPQADGHGRAPAARVLG